MRDIIWTIIILWVVWRVIDAFRTFGSAAKKTQASSSNYQNTTSNETNFQSSPKKGELKPDAGEYVDYEEVK